MLDKNDPIYHILVEYHKANPYVQEMEKFYTTIVEENNIWVSVDDQIMMNIFGEEDALADGGTPAMKTIKSLGGFDW